MLTFMADYDMIICPAMPNAAKPHHHGLMEINDFSHMMVQVVARPLHDVTVLAVAGHLEKVFGGWRAPPPLAA